MARDTIKLFNRTWLVRFTSKVPKGYDGLIDWDAGTIDINSRCSPEDTFEAISHELVHAATIGFCQNELFHMLQRPPVKASQWLEDYYAGPLAAAIRNLLYRPEVLRRCGLKRL